MKNKAIQVTLYPTPAPPADDILYEVDVVSEVTFVCEKLFLERWPLKRYDRRQVHDHFRSLAEIMTFEHHLEIAIQAEELSWELLLQELVSMLPQFAWIRCRTEPRVYGRKIYYIDFVPIALREEGFPFDLNTTESIVQQLFYEPEEALVSLCHDLEERFLNLEGLLHAEQTAPQQTEPVKQQPAAPQEPIKHAAKEAPVQHPKQSQQQGKVDSQLLVYQEEIKRDKYAKERMRIANEKLELMMEKLELSMMYGGLNHFDATDDDDSHWDKRLKISLREYSYLMQKAKYLEQVWAINGELVTKSERMTLNGNQLIYERDQVNRLKETISSSDIYLVMDECKLIESRAVIKNRPWFRKPYVKLMKMDYDSLLNKAAYFDLLQGESYLLEKMQREASRKKSAEEAG